MNVTSLPEAVPAPNRTLSPSRLVDCRMIDHVYRVAMSVNSGGSMTRSDLDSHADTCVLGANTLRVSDEGRKVTVYAFSGEHKPLNSVPIVTAATLWQDLKTGQNYILIINEGLYMGDKVKVTLLCPNQMRFNGLVVADVPRQFDPESSHSIYIPNSDLRIPLDVAGVASGFESRKPTWEEYEMYPHVELTAQSHWEPGTSFLEERERQVGSVRARATFPTTRDPIRNETRLVCAVQAFHHTTRMVFDDTDDLYHRLVARVIVAADDLPGDGLAGHVDDDVYPLCEESRQLFALSTTEKRSVLTSELLSRRC